MEIHHHHQEPEKVYVAIGSDIIDGFGALKIALKKWSSEFISIVILHATNDICKDYVFTPFGKLPASSLSEEKLKGLERAEQAMNDKILAKYIAYCGKVKAEVVKIDKHDDKPFQEVLLELISSLKISKLVMALTFMRLSSWTSKSAISGAFFVHQNKPDFCELFMIYCGELVFFKGQGENDGIIEDDKGVIVGRVLDRNSFKKWFRRMWSEKGVDNGKTKASPPSSSLPSTSSDSSSIWGKYHEEIEQYFNQLVASKEEGTENYVTDEVLLNDSPDSSILKNMVAKDRIEAVKAKICSTQEATNLLKKQVKVNIERQKRAEWAISLCTSRVETLTTSIENGILKRVDIQKELDSKKEVIYELQSEVEEKRTKLNSLLELQHELSSKLKSSNLEKSQAEFQLEKAVQTRTRIVHEIEDLRGQRDVLQRRIEFCREKDAIGNASRMSDVYVSFDYRKFTADEIRAATNDFASCLRFKSGRQWTNVYKGHLKHISVAIKLYDPLKFQSEDFISLVELHGNIRHPHLIGMIGFCSELNCIVFEYMHNGCLRERLFSNLNCSKGQNHIFSWHDRVRIVDEICSGLAFLHQAQPRPIVHGNLDPSKILLDRFHSTKIYGYKNHLSSNESPDIQSDIMAFGNVILQILTGRNFAVLDDEAIKIDSTAIIGFLDAQPGEWPQELAIQLCITAVKCLSRINIEAQAPIPSDDNTTNSDVGAVDSTPFLSDDSNSRRPRLSRRTPSLGGAARFLRRASSRRMMREPSVRVREAAAEQIEERQSEWAYSKPVVILDLVWNLAFVVVCVYVLVASRFERGAMALRVWIGGYGLQCVVHMGCVCLECRRRWETRRPRRRSGGWSSGNSSGSDGMEYGDYGSQSPTNVEEISVAKHLESANTMFSFIWWIIGFYWVSAGGVNLPQDSPQLYWLCITFLAFDVFFVVICVAVACVIGIAVCCCLPCIIAILYAVADQEGATKEDIERLPKYKFRLIGDFEKQNGEIQESFGGIMTECEVDSPMEHVLPQEDAECCICLCAYDDGAELRELPCRHHFHCSCIDKWLFINATCPLCKFNILKNGNQSGSEEV